MKRLFLTVLLLLSICVPANAAELLTLKNVNKNDVYNFILSENVKQGYTIKSTSDYSLVFEDNKQQSLDFYLTWGQNVKIVTQYSIVPSGPDLLISHEIQFIANPGSSQERTHIASIENATTYFPGNKETLETGDRQTKSDLRYIKAVFNGIYIYGLDYDTKKKKDSIEITKVWPNTPSEQAGIIVGDKIIKVNEISVKALSLEAFEELARAGEEGATINLIIVRNGKEIPITLTKQYLPPTFKK